MGRALQMIVGGSAPAGRAMSNRTPLGAMLVAAVSLACNHGPAARDGSASATDSAGVTIVVNDGAAAAVATWRTEPDLTIGEVRGTDEHVFGQIADVGVDPEGRFYVLDRQARRARVYDRGGRFLRDVGSPGEGPGELSDAVTGIVIGPSDSIYVVDHRQLRLNVYGPGGTPARTVPLHYGRQGPYQFWLLGDGRILVRWLSYVLDAEGRFVPWDAVLRSDPSGMSFDTLMVFDYRSPDFGAATGRLHRPLIPNTAICDVLADGRIAWSALEAHQVAVHGPTGGLASIVRNTSWSRHAITRAERAGLEALYRAEAGQRDDPVPDEVIFPDSLPVITALLADPEGGFWVQRMGPVPETDPAALFLSVRSAWLGGRTWEVYDAGGRLRATVRLPRRYRVTRILASAVVGVQKDALDVERVVRLRIVR